MLVLQPAQHGLPLGAAGARLAACRPPLLVQHVRRPTTCQMDASMAALDRAVQARTASAVVCAVDVCCQLDV